MVYILSLISGILTALPLIFENLWPLSWFSMIPFFYVLFTEKPKYRHGLVFSYGYYGVLYYWFATMYPMDFLGFSEGMAVLAIIVCWVGLSTLQALGTALIGWLFRFVKGNKKWLYPFEAAAVWVMLEFLQEQTWAGVPFCRLAISQCGSLQMIQSASLFGSLFIGFLIVLTNSFFALALINEIEKNKSGKNKIKPNLFAAIGASIIAINFLCGFLHTLYYQQDSETTVINAAVIQGNISSTDKWNNLTSAESCEIYCNLTVSATADCEVGLVVWPEGVINTTLSKSSSLQKMIGETAAECETYIIVGAFDKDEEGNLYNAMYIFSPDGEMSEERYYKQKLVPFGEFMPLKYITKIIPVLGELNIVSNEMTAGDNSEIFNTEYGRIGSLVCFDSIYSELTRQSVINGAQIITLGTNDSWYGDSAAIRIHRNQAVLRAVESGKYVVRAASTGQSCIISPIGEIKASVDALEKGYAVAEVSLNSSRTPYVIMGNIIVVFSAIIYSIAILLKITEMRNKPKAKKKEK